jgi:hypothetical protein
LLEVTQGLADDARQFLRGKDAGMDSCGDRLDRCSKLGRLLGTYAGGEQGRAHTAQYISRTRLRSPRRTGHCNQHRPTVRSCDDLRRTLHKHGRSGLRCGSRHRSDWILLDPAALATQQSAQLARMWCQ